MGVPWVYLLRCADESFYVGSTWDLEQRLNQHAQGCPGSYTEKRRPVNLCWAQEYERIDDAWIAERRIHGWSRAKKQALIEGRFCDLPRLSRNYAEFGSPTSDGSPASAESPST